MESSEGNGRRKKNRVRNRASAEPLKYVLRLSGFETLKEEGFTVYFVRVAVESGEDAVQADKRMWYLKKRFRDFWHLRQGILEANGVAPKLPDKKYFGNRNPEFVRTRAHGLSTFLWELAASPAMCSIKCVHDFLWSDVCVPPTRSLLPSTPLSKSVCEKDLTSTSLASTGFSIEEEGSSRPNLFDEENLVHQSSSDIADLQGCMVLRSCEDLQRAFANEGITFPEDDLVESDTGESDSDDGSNLFKSCSNFMPGLYKWYSGKPKGKDFSPSLESRPANPSSSDFDPKRIHFMNESKYSNHSVEQDDQFRLSLVPKLRFVILLVGSRGDVQPYIALGMALKRRGHYVRVAAHECFRVFVMDHGLSFAPIAGDPKELLKMVTENNMFSFQFVKEGISSHRTWVGHVLDDAWDACTLPEESLRSRPEDPATPRSPRNDTDRNVGSGPGRAFAARKSSFRADVVISNPPSFAGWHIAEALGVPLFMSFPMPWSRTKHFPSPFTNAEGEGASAQLNWMSYGAVDRLIWLGTGDLINRWRVKTLRIPPIWTMSARGHRLIHDNRVPYLYPWSPQVLPKPNDWGSHINIPGYWFLDDEIEIEKSRGASIQEPQIADHIQDFFKDENDPPIFIGFGSIVVANPKRLNDIIMLSVVAMSDSHRFVVQAGWSDVNVSGIPEHLAHRVLMIGPVPHRWLFERCKLIVHHGGAGTTAESIRAGKPSVVVPFFGDQFFWARQVNDIRVGARIAYSRLSVNKLCRAINYALGNGIRMRANVLGVAVRLEKGTELGVAFIERKILGMDTMMSIISSPSPAQMESAVVAGIEESPLNYSEWVARNIGRGDQWRFWPYMDLSDRAVTSIHKPMKAISSLGKRVKVVGSALKSTVVSPKRTESSEGLEVELQKVSTLNLDSKSELPTPRKLPVIKFSSTIPAGHTRYSWASNHINGDVPPGHTSFSWLGNSRRNKSL